MFLLGGLLSKVNSSLSCRVSNNRGLLKIKYDLKNPDQFDFKFYNWTNCTGQGKENFHDENMVSWKLKSKHHSSPGSWDEHWFIFYMSIDGCTPSMQFVHFLSLLTEPHMCLLFLASFFCDVSNK